MQTKKSLNRKMHSAIYGTVLVFYTLCQFEDCLDYILYDISLGDIYVESGDNYYLINPLVGSELRGQILDTLHDIYN